MSRLIGDARQDFWLGDGAYDPYGGRTETQLYTNIDGFAGGGGGGGTVVKTGTYLPPTKPDPTYVPTNNTINGNIKINCKSIFTSKFSEESTVLGYGKYLSKNYTFINFGELKTYKAESDLLVPLNYFTVEIVPKYNKYAEAVGLTGDNQSSLITSRILDKISITKNSNLLLERYAEVVSVKEYELSSDGSYKFTDEKQFDMSHTDGFGKTIGSSNIIADLEFKFKARERAISGYSTSPDVPYVSGYTSVSGYSNVTVPPKVNKKYSVLFNSNYKSELADLLTLTYEVIFGAGELGDALSAYYLTKENIKLSVGNSEPKELDSDLIKSLKFAFRIDGTISSRYKVKGVYYTTTRVTSDRSLPFDKIDFSKWNKVDTIFQLNAVDVSNDIYVYIVFDKEPEQIIPELKSDKRIYEVEVRDSDKDKKVTIPFRTTDATHVDAHLENGRVIRLNATDSRLILSFTSDFSKKYGVNRVRLLPVNQNLNVKGNWVTVLINFLSVDNFPSIIQTTAPALIDIPAFSDSNIDFEIMYKSLNATSVDIDLLLKNNKRISFQRNAPTDNKIKININDLAKKYSDWRGSDNVTLILKPYNRGGEKELVGNEYQIVTKISYPSIQLDEQIIKKAFYDAFYKHTKLDKLEPESKYLTHLLNLGDDSRLLISTFDEDNWTLSEKIEDDIGNISIKPGGEVNSVLVKLYTPLPPEVEINDTIWITKIVTNPLVETVVLNQQADKEKKYLKGPNFDIDIDIVKGTSTNYESLDDLILSSSSSTSLIQKFISGSNITLEELNIQYVDGSISENSAEYIWENFVHFSSAEERIKNFVYKLQLIESYENLIISASTNYTGGGNASWTGSLASKQEVERQTIKKNALIQGFDGFEMFLFTSSSQYTTATSSSMTWPFNNGVRLKTSNTQSVGWYNNIIGIAAAYDLNNSNYLINNIPQFITTNTENDNFLLFFSMVGHHFDILYFYTKALENSRLKGYKSKNGLSDGLLFDYLKSFGWDAKNLGSGVQLWEYLYGENADGSKSSSNNIKARNNEVWRRIVNNLPYLLKHKGTRRGIYALMACYGIPSSNLSIIEFGGPEIDDETISRLLIDDKSYAIKMTPGAQISVPWNITNQNRRPDTIETFVKPSYSDNWRIFNIGSNISTGNKVGVDIITSSIDDRFGKVIFTDKNNIVSSSFLPLFNNRFFGVSVVRTLSGSNQTMQLNVMQTEGDREIFNFSTSASYMTASSGWNNPSPEIIYFGNSDFSGSIDEIRLWSTPLDKVRFEEHVYYPEAINGNHISSSTSDLHLRLDFEYPKNLASLGHMPNVAPILKYSSSFVRNDYEDGLISYNTIIKQNPSASLSASLDNFTNITTYPYQFEVIERYSVLEIPSLGASRYSSNKVRFVTQSLVSNLSSNSRATKRSSEYAPIDSNRIGVFVSPMKELNLDIAKSLGSNRLDDYVGDPSDLYNDTYKELNNLRRYYFQRVKNPDMYEYINIIKSYEKAMFDDIKQMLPARTKATTGLLIEPHFLERNKHKYKKPEGDWYDKEQTIDVDRDVNLVAENNQYEAYQDLSRDVSFTGENNQYDTVIDLETITPSGESNQLNALLNLDTSVKFDGEIRYYETTIDAKNDFPAIDILAINTETNYDTFENVSFATYIENDKSGSAIRTYYDEYGHKRKERVNIYEIYETYTEKIKKYVYVASERNPFTGVFPWPYGDIRGGFVDDTRIQTRKKIMILPFTGSNGQRLPRPQATGSIVSVRPVTGYLKGHYRNVGDLTTGMQNSYFKGSKNTRATTIDGSSPIEVFTSNPNAIRVLPGRSSTEPIIGTDI